MAIKSSLLHTVHQKVGLAISKLSGIARKWALTCDASVDAELPTWESFKGSMFRVFAPFNQAYCVYSRILALKIGLYTSRLTLCV